MLKRIYASVGLVSRIDDTTSLKDIEDFAHQVNYSLAGDKLYAKVRAMSAVVNLNYDGFSRDELKQAYRSFEGKPVYVEHDNMDTSKARGRIVAAEFEDDKEHGGVRQYACINLLLEIDQDRYPLLAKAIKEGKINTVSMGCDVEYSICSVCGNRARTERDYCDHIRNKGQTFYSPKEGKEVVAYEDNRGVSFFEISWVKSPADESAQRLAKVASGEFNVGEEVKAHYFEYVYKGTVREINADGTYKVELQRTLNGENLWGDFTSNSLEKISNRIFDKDEPIGMGNYIKDNNDQQGVGNFIASPYEKKEEVMAGRRKRSEVDMEQYIYERGTTDWEPQVGDPVVFVVDTQAFATDTFSNTANMPILKGTRGRVVNMWDAETGSCNVALESGGFVVEVSMDTFEIDRTRMSREKNAYNSMNQDLTGKRVVLKTGFGLPFDDDEANRTVDVFGGFGANADTMGTALFVRFPDGQTGGDKGLDVRGYDVEKIIGDSPTTARRKRSTMQFAKGDIVVATNGGTPNGQGWATEDVGGIYVVVEPGEYMCKVKRPNEVDSMGFKVPTKGLELYNTSGMGQSGVMARRKKAWTEDGSDVPPIAKKLMAIVDNMGGLGGYTVNDVTKRQADVDRIIAQAKPLLEQATQADVDALEDYNYHNVNTAIAQTNSQFVSYDEIAIIKEYYGDKVARKIARKTSNKRRGDNLNKELYLRELRRRALARRLRAENTVGPAIDVVDNKSDGASKAPENKDEEKKDETKKEEARRMQARIQRARALARRRQAADGMVPDLSVPTPVENFGLPQTTQEQPDAGAEPAKTEQTDTVPTVVPIAVTPPADLPQAVVEAKMLKIYALADKMVAKGLISEGDKLNKMAELKNLSIREINAQADVVEMVQATRRPTVGGFRPPVIARRTTSEDVSDIESLFS